MLSLCDQAFLVFIEHLASMLYLYLLTVFVKVGQRIVSASIYLAKSIMLPRSELKRMLGNFSYALDLSHSDKAIMEREDYMGHPGIS